jgi:hypothetical protein
LGGLGALGFLILTGLAEELFVGMQGRISFVRSREVYALVGTGPGSEEEFPER